MHQGWTTQITEAELSVVRAARRHADDPAPIAGSAMLLLIARMSALLDRAYEDVAHVMAALEAAEDAAAGMEDELDATSAELHAASDQLAALATRTDANPRARRGADPRQQFTGWRGHVAHTREG